MTRASRFVRGGGIRARILDLIRRVAGTARIWGPVERTARNVDAVRSDLRRLHDTHARSIASVEFGLKQLSAQMAALPLHKDPDGRWTDEAIIASFESLYNPATGEWNLPPLLIGADRFSPDKAAEFLRRPPHCAPLEKEVADLFAAIVATEQPSQVLETGTNMGYSSAKIALALDRLPPGRERRLITIDPMDNHPLFRDMRCGRLVTYLCGRSDAVPIPAVEFDMLVLDSDHHYGTIAGELERFEPMLKAGGTILFHDSVFFDGVALAVAGLARTGRFEVITLRSPRNIPGLSRPPGIPIARKRRSAASEAEVFRRDAALDEVFVDRDPARVHDATWLVDLPGQTGVTPG